MPTLIELERACSQQAGGIADLCHTVKTIDERRDMTITDSFCASVRAFSLRARITLIFCKADVFVFDLALEMARLCTADLVKRTLPELTRESRKEVLARWSPGKNTLLER